MTTQTERRGALRAVLIGCGRMGRLHARRLMERDDVELIGIIDPIPPPEPELAALHRASLPPMDFAVIAAPTPLHAALAAPLLAAGVPALVEKPLAATPAEAWSLARHAALSVAHLERFNPAVRALPVDLRPRYLRAERLAPPPGRGQDMDVIADLMVHDLDLVLTLAGGAVVSLDAVGVPVRGPGVDIADVRLETDSGCVACLVASRVSRRRSRTLRVVGEGDYWSLDLDHGRAERVRWGEGALEAEPVEVRGPDAITALHDAFVAAVRGRAPFPAPGVEGARAVELAEAVTRRCLGRLAEP